jgi:hypothetical protein
MIGERKYYLHYIVEVVPEWVVIYTDYIHKQGKYVTLTKCMFKNVVSKMNMTGMQLVKHTFLLHRCLVFESYVVNVTFRSFMFII